MKILIKCADLSNELRPNDIAGVWLDCLLAEYFKQVCTTNHRWVGYKWFNIGRCGEGARITSWTSYGS